VHVDLREEMVGSTRPVLGRLSAAIAVAFLTLCFNVGSLFLVRAQARRAEVALRGALGATRARVAQQLLTEIVTPFLLAIGPAWLWSAWLAEALYAMSMRNTGRSWPTLQMDVRSMLAAFLCALGAGLAFGLLPALSLSRHAPFVDADADLDSGERGTVAAADPRRARGDPDRSRLRAHDVERRRRS
jgi:putative ABC transport system permease protein